MGKKGHQLKAGSYDNANLLISILVRYPEVGSIAIDPQNNVFRFTYMISTELAAVECQRFESLLHENLNALHMLIHTQPTMLKISINCYQGITIIDIDRDINTVAHEEFSLITSLLRKTFNKYVVCDHNDLLEEDLLYQEELIENMLEDLKFTALDQGMVGFREDGRVMVYNK